MIVDVCAKSKRETGVRETLTGLRAVPTRTVALLAIGTVTTCKNGGSQCAFACVVNGWKVAGRQRWPRGGWRMVRTTWCRRTLAWPCRRTVVVGLPGAPERKERREHGHVRRTATHNPSPPPRCAPRIAGRLRKKPDCPFSYWALAIWASASRRRRSLSTPRALGGRLGEPARLRPGLAPHHRNRIVAKHFAQNAANGQSASQAALYRVSVERQDRQGYVGLGRRRVLRHRLRGGR